MENLIHSWKTKEFEHYDKGSGWYLTLGVIAFMMIAYQIYMRDYFAAIDIAIVLAIFYFFAQQIPRDITITISDKGVRINQAYFPYHNLRRFWIVDNHETKRVYIETTAYLNRTLIILLNEEDSDQIAAMLRRFLPEGKPNQETFAQRFARILKF